MALIQATLHLKGRFLAAGERQGTFVILPQGKAQQLQLVNADLHQQHLWPKSR